MPIYMVTARWIETFTMAVQADSPQAAEDYISMIACDSGVREETAQRYDSRWAIDAPQEATEDINPRKLMDATDA